MTRGEAAAQVPARPRRPLSSWLLAAIAMVAGCSRQDAPAVGAIEVGSTLAPEQHLRRHIDQTPLTLDPSLSADTASQRVIDDLFEGLVRLDPAGQVVPAVAASWEISPDGLLYRFHLRPDARWSNGDPLTAADFVFAWRRTVEPRTGSEYAGALEPVVNATQISEGKAPAATLGATAPDVHTLEVRLRQPTPYFLWLLTNQFFYPLHGATLAAHGDRWTRPEHMVCNGAFVLRQLMVGGSISLERNPRYWDAAAVQLQKVTYYPVPDRTAAASRFLAGDLDFVDSVSPDDIQRLRAQLGSQVSIAPYFGTLMFALQLNKPPFAGNRALRQALTMSLDREILARVVLKDLFVPAYNLVPALPGYPQELPAWAKLDDDARHALARQRYAEAGYSQEHPLRIDLTHPTISTDLRRMMEAMAAMWRTNLGAEVRLSNQEWRVLQQERRLGKPLLYWMSWIGDFPDPMTFLALFVSDNSQNFGGYRNPRYDALVREGMQSADDATRDARFTAAERELNEDVPFVPIYFYKNRHLVKPYVQGFEGNLMDRHLSRDMRLLAHRER